MDDGAIGSFTVRRIATSGCEIRDPNGCVVAWAATEPWAFVIAGLLNWVEAEGLLDYAGKTLWVDEISDGPRKILENCRDEMKDEETKWGI